MTLALLLTQPSRNVLTQSTGALDPTTSLIPTSQLFPDLIGDTHPVGGGTITVAVRKNSFVGIYNMPPAPNLFPGPNLYPGNANTQVYPRGGGQVNAVGVRSAQRLVGISGGGPVIASNGVKGGKSPTTLSGGGRPAIVTLKTISDPVVIPGGGLTVTTALKQRSGAVVLPGGGNVTVQGAVRTAVTGGGTVVATAKRGAASATAVNGGGGIIAGPLKGAKAITAVNGGGVIVASNAVIPKSSAAIVNGGGRVTVTKAEAITADLVITGGGFVLIQATRFPLVHRIESFASISGVIETSSGISDVLEPVGS